MVHAVVLSTLAEHRTRFAISLAGQSYLGSCLTHEVVYTRAMISDKPLIPYSSSNVRALSYRNFYTRKIHLLFYQLVLCQHTDVCQAF